MLRIPSRNIEAKKKLANKLASKRSKYSSSTPSGMQHINTSKRSWRKSRPDSKVILSITWSYFKLKVIN